MKKFDIPLLSSEDIEVKIKKCMKAGAIALLYKTARTDYRILDEVFGTLGWQVEYEEIKGNLYCTVSLWDDENKHWVKKTNCGIESREDEEGNEKKGEASDAAKRAGTVVGIGAELYTSPSIFLDVKTEEKKTGGWGLADPNAKYVVTKIEYNEKTRVITALTIANEKSGVEVFSWTMPKTGAKAKKMERTVGEQQKKKEEAPTPKEEKVAPKAEAPAPKAEKPAPKAEKPVPQANSQPAAESVSNGPKMPLKTIITNIGMIVKKMADASGDLTPYTDIVTKVAGTSKFKCNRATEADYETVLKIYESLVAAGYDK